MSSRRKIIYLIGFIFSLPIALMSYINSTFISSFVDEKLVGIVYALGSVISIIFLLIAPKIWRRIGSYKFLLWVASLDALSILLLPFSVNTLSAVVIFICGFTLNILVYAALDEFLKISSENSVIGKTRGSYLAICSLAWVIAQLGLGTILGEFSFTMIYLFSFFLMLIFALMSFMFLKGTEDPKYDNENTKQYLGEFFKNKNLSRTYSINLLLQLFYCWMVIYTPIYLSLHLGFSWQEIGIIFAVMLIPFVIIPFHLGKYADKIGERKILICAFLIVSLSTLLLFFTKSREVWVWAVLLLATRVGASSVEDMIDAYFFKHIRPENEEFVDVYRSATPLSYILGPVLALLCLKFVPSFNYLYLVLGALMLLGVYLSSTIKRSDI